jgi:hypothetical protein
MLSPNLVRVIDTLAAEIKTENPEILVDDFALKAKILDKIRQVANEEADLMIQAAQLTEIVKCLAELVRLS